MKLIKFLFIFLTLLILHKPLAAQTNIQEGLYIGGRFDARISPYLDGGGTILLFYRFISGVFPGYIWEGIKTDFGINNHLNAEFNKLSIFVNSSISKYFNIDAQFSLLNYYISPSKRGFVHFDSPDSKFSVSDISNANKTSNIGFEAKITPIFKVSFLDFLFNGRGLTLQAGLEFKYAHNEKGKYHLDYDLLLIRDQDDISYKLDSLLLFDLVPLSVGINYMLAYMNNTKQLWQSIGVYGNFKYDFLRRFSTEISLKIGQYLVHPVFPSKLYLDMNAQLIFRII